MSVEYEFILESFIELLDKKFVALQKKQKFWSDLKRLKFWWLSVLKGPEWVEKAWG